MAEKLLTDRKCQAAKVGSGEETLLGDGGNLYLRIRPKSKDWLFIYRSPLDSKRKKYGLGGFPDVSLAEARKQAQDARILISQGADPQTHRAEQIAFKRAEKAIQESLPQTVSELFSEWLKRDLKRRRADEGAGVERSFKKDVMPQIGDLPLSTIRRAHITQLLDKTAERGVTRTVGILLADLRQMFAFGVERDLLPGDPTAGLKKTSWNGISGERDRVLSEAEVKSLAKQLKNAVMIEGSQHAIFIMLTTLARIGELTKAKWKNLDFENATWLIPPEDSKNSIAHTIDLPVLAIQHFRALHEAEKNKASAEDRELSEYVFPAKYHKGRVCEKSLTKQIRIRQYGESEIIPNRKPFSSSLVLPGGKWTPHDLRRTGATMMGSLGVAPHVIEKCLNHVEQDRMKRIYQRQELRPEMKAAWALIGEKIRELTTPTEPAL